MPMLKQDPSFDPRRYPRVDFIHNDRDFRVIELGAMGFSLHRIMKDTRYSMGQVTYRLGKVGIKLSDYRDGTSPFAVRLARNGRLLIRKSLRGMVRSQS